MSLRSLRLMPMILCLGCAVLTGRAPEALPEEPAVRIAEKKSADNDAQLLTEAAKRLDDGEGAGRRAAAALVPARVLVAPGPIAAGPRALGPGAPLGPARRADAG